MYISIGDTADVEIIQSLYRMIPTAFDDRHPGNAFRGCYLYLLPENSLPREDGSPT